MNKAVFITVRTGSSRLPKKALLEIGDKCAIEHVMERAKRAKKADKVIMCTTILKEDDALCGMAEKHNISFYRGSVKDKLQRWLEAAKKYDVDFFVTADGDDLFCEPELMDRAFDQYERNHPDFIESKDLICGAFSYAIKTKALKRVCEIKDTDDTEMMWVYFTGTGIFKTEILKSVPPVFKRPEMRMTLDYEDDLKFFRKVAGGLAGRQGLFTLRDVIDFLDKNPEVIKINQYLQEKFLDNQRKKTRLAIKDKA